MYHKRFCKDININEKLKEFYKEINKHTDCFIIKYQ